MENPQVMALLIRVLETKQNVLILRVFRVSLFYRTYSIFLNLLIQIWRRTVRFYSNALISADIVSILVPCIRYYWLKSPLAPVETEILKISIQILQLLAPLQSYRGAILNIVS